MIQSDNLNDSVLKRFVKVVSPGEYLFKAGDFGSTIYIIVSGTVQIFKKNIRGEALIGTLGDGEILGEKAILKDAGYRRNFTAQAKTEAIVLEFDKKSMSLIQGKLPDFLIRMVTLLSERLEQANEMITILQSQEEAERLVLYLKFFSQYHSKKVSGGHELIMTAEDIHSAINMDKEKVGDCLEELVAKKVLIKQKLGYILRDENALAQHISSLKECLAA
ncbi:MAG: Crp/Fnr family transcriptional regulator [Deltaproteobacteria bacterium]|nr:Crp/Fnr family transcriptional regulator [Deltaproteobacteria bacterium]